MSRGGRLWTQDCGHKTAFPLKMMLGPPSLSQMHSTRWCGRRIAQVPPCFPRRTKWMKSRSSLGLWWCCIAHLWGVTFREEGRPRGNLRPETPFYTGFSGFVLKVPAPLKLSPGPTEGKQFSKCSANCLQAKTPETSFTKFISVHASESTCLSGKSVSLRICYLALVK